MNDYKELIEDLRLGADILPKKGILLFGGEDMTRIADAIEQLVAEYNELDNAHDKMFLELCKVKRERDAAVADIKKNWMCATCSKRIVGKEWLYCLHLLPVEAEDGSRTCLNYKWRGVRE